MRPGNSHTLPPAGTGALPLNAWGQVAKVRHSVPESDNYSSSSKNDGLTFGFPELKARPPGLRFEQIDENPFALGHSRAGQWRNMASRGGIRSVMQLDPRRLNNV